MLQALPTHAYGFLPAWLCLHPVPTTLSCQKWSHFRNEVMDEAWSPGPAAKEVGWSVVSNSQLSCLKPLKLLGTPPHRDHNKDFNSALSDDKTCVFSAASGAQNPDLELPQVCPRSQLDVVTQTCNPVIVAESEGRSTLNSRPFSDTY